MILEVCVDSVFSAIEAQKGGADRVELCANLDSGGTTPSLSTIRLARKYLKIPMFVLIRPRTGDFLYDEYELEVIQEDIAACKDLGADGIVIGMLKASGRIDIDRMTPLISFARPLGVTFHRAFDMASDPFQALEDIISLGADRILTSGGLQTALKGAALIRMLVDQAGNRISIMPGGGITKENIQQIAFQTGASEYHGSFRKFVISEMEFRNDKVRLGGNKAEEYEMMMTDIQSVRKVKNILKQFGT